MFRFHCPEHSENSFRHLPLIKFNLQKVIDTKLKQERKKMSGSKPDDYIIRKNDFGMWNITKIIDLKEKTILPGLINAQRPFADAINTIAQANVSSPPSDNSSDIEHI